MWTSSGFLEHFENMQTTPPQTRQLCVLLTAHAVVRHHQHAFCISITHDTFGEQAELLPLKQNSRRQIVK